MLLLPRQRFSDAKATDWVEVRKRKAQAKSTPVQEVKHSHANESADVGTEDRDEEGPNGTGT